MGGGPSEHHNGDDSSPHCDNSSLLLIHGAECLFGESLVSLS
jgi:hypothetical protein